MAETVPSSEKKLRWSWKKHFSLLIVLVALVVGLNFLYQPASTWVSVIAGDPGDFLYIATFDGFEDEWTSSEGRIETQINDSSIRISIDKTGSVAWSAAKPQFFDFDVQVKSAAVDGPLDNGFGLIFRLQDEQNLDCAFSVILCDLGRLSPLLNFGLEQIIQPEAAKSRLSYYMFLISSDGFYSVWNVSEGQPPQKLSAWIASSLINQGIGEKNILRVVGRGNQFQFFINGEQVEVCIPNDPSAESTYVGGECLEGRMLVTLTDDRHQGGQVAVVAQTALFEGGVIVEFDNLVVFSPKNGFDSNEVEA